MNPNAESDASGSDSATRPITAVLVGNPNAGKSTLFNHLTGLSQKVANFPGVTVETHEGQLRRSPVPITIIDVPGTYSLAANSPDEVAAIEVILGRRDFDGAATPPDVIVHVVDASNLERNLYLFSQLRELGRPLVIVLNMLDVAKRRGIEIDPDALAERLGATVVVTQGQKGVGIEDLSAAIIAKRAEGDVTEAHREFVVLEAFAPAVQQLLENSRELIRAKGGRELYAIEALRLIFDRGGFLERHLTAQLGPEFEKHLETARASIPSGRAASVIESEERHHWVSERLEGVIRHPAKSKPHLSERIDDVLMSRWTGLPIFAAIMLLLFQSIFSWAGPLMDLIDGTFGTLGEWAAGLLPDGMLQSLIVDGIIGGVGGVVIFLPQILILFLFIGLLEDCGYMARAAFLMDKLMSKCGLSGKSFIPMLSGFACAIPGIMAARVIEDRRDRLATILVVPLMTCSARLPVYAILIGTFIPEESYLGGLLGLQALTLFGLYVLGIVAAVAVAFLLKKTLLRGAPPTFVLELPSYKVPSFKTVLLRLFDRGKAFLMRAGTIILAISVIVWALSYFPHSSDVSEAHDQERQVVSERLEALPEADAAGRAALEEKLDDIDRREAGQHLRESYFGRLGHGVEPLFEPLGWDWRISMAAIASFPAREVIVATLGTIYNLGDEEDEESETLRTKLREAKWDGSDKPVFSVPIALSILVFFALCCQCGATVAMIKREANSWGWAWFAFGYMTALAYGAAFVAYQVSSHLLG